MPARKLTPSYLLHRQSGRGRLVWTDPSGKRHDEILPGPFGSQESLAAKARRELELAISPVAAAPVDPAGLTVAEVLAAYHRFAVTYYRDADGNEAGELQNIRASIRPVRELYATTPAIRFGPVALKAVRQRMIDSGLCRSQINKRIDRVKRAFRWAASEELVPAAVYDALRTLPGLRRGRTEARESEPVKPVEDAAVDATLPFLNRHVRGLVEFQRLTGCRPGEACRLRRCDIDTGGTVWLYRPAHHKTAHHGKTRTIAIGPKAQDLLRDYFTPNIGDYLFSPRRAIEELRAERASSRKTPRYPSHMKRNATKRKPNPKRMPSERYDRDSYGRAVRRACREAGVSPWHPHQLRHAYATRVRKQHGLEAAQVLLGHSKADVTQIYAERDEALAIGIAAKIG